MKIDLKRTLDNQQQELLLQQLFTGSHVPENLVGMVRSFQEACIEQGIEDKLHFKESMVKRCEIQIGTLHFSSSSLDEEKANKKLAEQIAKEKGKASGQLDWKFTGVNQFGSVTIRVHERSWQVEFSRLQRRISAFITDEADLTPKAHQALYEEMKETLQPLASSGPSQMLILQGASGLGKSHCVEHYFYHEANKHHQMVAWLSGESKEAFLRDWEALANQLRSIDSKRKENSDTALIRHWCEKQLGQWLFIIDDLQIEIDWVRQYLPQKGGHALITTSQPSYSLPEAAKILSFFPLSAEDSELLLKAWLGKNWEAAGFAKEAQALRYFSEALGGSPALLTQIALLVRKKGLSFERVMSQFQDAETRSLLLVDTIFDQLEGPTFLDGVKKGWQQWVMALRNHYPQFTTQEHGVHLKQFIGILKQHVGQELEKTPQAYVDENLIIAYWQGVWASLSCEPLNVDQIISCLHLLPLAYDKANQRWAVSMAGLHALQNHGSEKDLSSALPTVTTISPAPKEKWDLPQIPSGVSLSMSLENSSLGSTEVALLTTGKPAEFTTWRPPTTNPYFIPRPALTEEIAEKLPSKNTHEQSVKLMLVAASGMGGIGKTELARHFITTPELSSHYKKRFWFNAANTATLRNEFHDFAGFLGLIEPKEYVEDKILIHRLHRWFNLNPGWLMILDNADEYNGIAQWIPKEGGAVLITTREPKPGILMDEQIVKISLLTAEEAIIWLYRLAQRDQNAASDTEQKAARELVDNLGYLPLAIAQSAAYLREQKAISIEAYQQNFLELLLKDESLIEQNKPIDKQSDAYSRRVIANTWKLSLQMIEAYAKQKGLFNACPWLLAACSYLASKDIPLGLLEYWFKESFELEVISPQLLSYILDEYIAQLLRYSLCERAGLTSMISMHRLVQEVLRSDLAQALPLPTETEEVWEEIGDLANQTEQKGWIKKGINPRVFPSLSVALVNYSVEFTPLIEDWKRRIELISHLQRIIATWERRNSQVEINPEILIALYARLVEVQLGLRADAKEALTLCQKQLDLCQKHYGPEHPKVVGMLVNLAIAYGILGDAKQQKSLLERALSIFEHHYGTEHPDVARTLLNLGIAYGDLGDYKQQKRLLERALSIFEQHHGSEHPETAKMLTSLANAHGNLGDAQRQKILLERALRIDKQHYGSEHPEVARTLTNLGRAYGTLGDDQQKKSLLEKALHIEEQHYGPEHFTVAQTLRSLGNACGALGDAQQQKILLERALPILEKHYGLEHPTVARTLINLGDAYGALGNYKQQKSLLERALSILEQYYDPGNPDVAKTLASLGNAYGALGDAKQQKHLLERALPILEQHYGPEHFEVARTLANLGNAYGGLGDAQQQKRLLERALLIFEQHYGPEHPMVARALTNLGDAYGALGDAQQQKQLLERALPILQRCYGSEHPYIARALASLGNAHGAMGDVHQQKHLLEKALLILEQHYGPEHIDVAKALNNLGIAYGNLGNAQQQKSLLERALPIVEHYYGPEHPEVASTLVDLGNVYGALGDAWLQKELLERALPIFEKHYGREHPHVARMLTNLSNAYDAMGDAQQQKRLLERALPILGQHYGPEHPEVAKTLTNLGIVYNALGDAEQQKRLLEKALLIFERYYGPEHPQVAKPLENLGNAYGMLGDFKQQNILLTRALLIRKHQYGATSYNSASHKQMGDLLLHYQRPLDAIVYYEKALEIDPNSSGIRHNLACCYHVRGDIEKADFCFQIEIALFPASSILAEYAHFLIKHRKFQEPLSFIEQCLQAVIDSKLSYGIAEYPIVLSAIQHLMDRHPSRSIELSAQGLAHYLQVICYQMCQQKEQAQQAMKHFELWIAQQTDAQQQEIFQSLKNSLVFEAESIALNLLSSEQQLFQAVEAGNLNLIQTIIEKQNVSIDWQEPASQKTTLHLACISQQRDVILYLLSKMARFDIKDKDEKLAWEYVINTPLLELFKTTSVLFTQKYSAAVNAGIFMDWGKVLRMAVASDYLADVRFLIEVKGIDINSVDANPKTRYTALHLAVIRNKAEVAKYLVSKGADVNALDANKKIPRDYITPEQKELLALFPIAAKNMSVEESELSLEKLRL